MITVVVNFPLPEGMSLDEFKSRMIKSVPRYQTIPGLVRKNYLYDGKHHVGGGAYTFDTRAQAEECFSEEFVKAVSAAYGKPEIRYFETPILVDNEHGVVKD
jgi:hypothetical protein